ncbi:MAG: serine/threonine protein kinase, partial [Deltaproteobacteria bacterium HGW-Deltaproteobacteria-20]
MATVHYGRQLGHAGFTRTVAIKRMHPHCARDPDFVSMFLDEGRLAARIRHPNVVPILDVVSTNHELWLVMDFVLGETLARALRAGRKIGRPPPVRVTSAILTGVLEGLHAAHEAVSEQGDPLSIVHRDVSPQNIMVGADGVARVLDFGIAKASVRLQTTRDGQLKGKLQYMAPEQILEQGVDRRTDVFAASVVLWEALAGRRLFEADSEPAIMRKVLEEPIPSVREVAKDVPEQLACVVDQGLSRNPDDRFQSAQAMAIAIEHAAGVATPREVAAWLSEVASEAVKARSADIAEIESQSMSRDLLSIEASAQADHAVASSRRPESATLSDLPS